MRVDIAPNPFPVGPTLASCQTLPTRPWQLVTAISKGGTRPGGPLRQIDRWALTATTTIGNTPDEPVRTARRRPPDDHSFTPVIHMPSLFTHELTEAQEQTDLKNC